MNYLFLVTIGPVQDFIASARRTGDLAFGSWFLSEMARAVAYQIVQENGLKSLIFPAPPNEEELNSEQFNVANKIVACIEQEPQKLAENIEVAIRQRLHKIRDEAYRNILLPKDNREIADKQIDDLIEFSWGGLPYEPEKGDYKEKREELEALMAARKNTRDFQAVPWKRMYVLKSSIDGQLESVIPEYYYPSRRFPDATEKIRKLYKQYKAGPAERLSGVDLLKRYGMRQVELSSDTDSSVQHSATRTVSDSEFLSTPHMAAIPFLERLTALEDPGRAYVKTAWDAYVEQFRKAAAFPDAVRAIPESHPAHPILGRQDGGMLFEDQLVDMLCLTTYDTERDKKLQPVKNALRRFYDSIDEQFKALGMGKARPNPYYALLQADGDSMGEIIDAQAQNGHAQHQRLSQALSSFAKGVRETVKNNKGALVYAGGDDVLAFLPLHTVLQCANELAAQFRNALDDFADLKGRKPTLSVGIAVTHYLSPLRETRRLAKQAEDRAKSVDGKNALAITISKRSGEEYSITDSWSCVNDHMEKLIGFCREDAIPGGTPYELRDLVLRLSYPAPQSEVTAEKLREVMKLDALRILHRKLCVPLGKFSKEKAKEVEDLLKERIARISADEEAKKNPLVILNRLINELIVAQTLAEARELADLKPGGKP